jgi:hypothetical protein
MTGSGESSSVCKGHSPEQKRLKWLCWAVLIRNFRSKTERDSSPGALRLADFTNSLNVRKRPFAEVAVVPETALAGRGRAAHRDTSSSVTADRGAVRSQNRAKRPSLSGRERGARRSLVFPRCRHSLDLGQIG